MSAIPVSIGLPPSAEPAHFILPGVEGMNIRVFDLGLACCAVEFAAASVSHRDLLRPEAVGGSTDQPGIEVMVISGTVTDQMAPTIKRLYDELSEPKYVVSFGSCSNSGGPYWDSYCVTKGVDQLVPVDVYVPGCPPRPDALVHGLRVLQDKLASGDLGPAT